MDAISEKSKTHKRRVHSNIKLDLDLNSDLNFIFFSDS